VRNREREREREIVVQSVTYKAAVVTRMKTVGHFCFTFSAYCQ
jgi:hypothetical protein